MKRWEWAIWGALRLVGIVARIVLSGLVLLIALLIAFVLYSALTTQGWLALGAFVAAFVAGCLVIVGLIWLCDYYDDLDRKRISLHTEGGG